MRIVLYSDNFYPELSGITDTIITTGLELRKGGHDIAYVGPYYSPKDYATGKRPWPEDAADDTIDGIPIFRLSSIPMPFSPTGQSRFVLSSGSSLSFVKAFQPDIIHTQSPYGVGWEAKRVAKALGVPLVGTNHTAVEDFFPLGSVMRSYDAWYYNHCAVVTTPYKMLISRMREKGFHRPAHVVANPVDIASFRPATREEKTEAKRALGLSGPVLLYTGRLGVEKKIDVIVRALAIILKQIPDLTFIATGHGAAEKSLRALARDLGVDASVRFPGFIPRADFPRLYHAADIFTMLSTCDSQSIALMQAYASGIPAVCARARGLPDYTPEDSGFLVEPGDVHSLASTLVTLLRDDALREEMGKAARIFVERFSPENIARDWLHTYHGVLSH
jgi:glycosyltransferase involved in cell wall biosynthesis